MGWRPARSLDQGRPWVGPSMMRNQRPGRQLCPSVQPRSELLPAPLVHADLASAPSPAVADEPIRGGGRHRARRERARPGCAAPSATRQRSLLARASRDGRRRFVASRPRPPRRSAGRRDSACPCCAAVARRGSPAGIAGERRRPTASNSTVIGPRRIGQQMPTLPYTADGGRATARAGKPSVSPSPSPCLETTGARPERRESGASGGARLSKEQRRFGARRVSTAARIRPRR